MDANQKKCNLLIQILFFAFLAIDLQNSFALKETVIEITDIPQTAPASLVFNGPGKQKVTLENHLQKDLAIGGIYFVGDEFTAPCIAADIKVSSVDGCSVIKAKTSCSLMVEARDNASASINSTGELVFLSYRIKGEQEDKFAQLRIKRDYNNDIIFKERNLEISSVYDYEALAGDSACDDQLKKIPRKLTIINNNPSYSVNVTDIQLAENKSGLGVGDYASCSSLKSGSSCQVEITLDGSSMAEAEAVPIYVTYDRVDVNNTVVMKGSKAIAAAIVNSEKVTQQEAQIVKSLYSGGVTGGTIVVPYADITQEFIKKIFVVILPGSHEIATDFATGVLAGGGYFSGDKLIEAKVTDYNSEYHANKIISATATYSVVALATCPRADTAAFAFCAAATVGCGLLGTFGGKAVTDALYSDIVYHLPEQGWYDWLKEKSRVTQLPIDFLSAAALRVGCRAFSGIPHGGFTELWQDTLSATVMVPLDSMFKKTSCVVDTQEHYF